MTGTDRPVLKFLGAFAYPERRREAAADLAQALGVDDILVFAPDPEIGVLLPAPGLPQTLPGGPAWREFLVRCREAGLHLGRLPAPGGEERPAYGCSSEEGTVLVLLGDHAAEADLGALRTAAPVLGALIQSEREAQGLTVRSRAADEAATKAKQLAGALAQAHARLQAAFAETERAKQETENLTEELHAQAAEREEVNDQLALSESRLQSVIDSSLDAIVTIDPMSTIQGWNRPAEKIFGWSAAEVLGRTLTDTIIPPQHREAHLKGMERFLTTGEGPILNRRIEITALRRNGSEFPIELTISPSGQKASLVFSAFIRDITERRDAELRREAEQRATRVLSESHSIEAAAEPLLEALGSAFGWKLGALWTVDDAEGRLRCVGTWQASGVDALKFVSVTHEADFGRGEGLPGRVWESGRPTWISNVTEDVNFPRAASAARDGLHAAFAFPIIAENDVLGVAEYFSPEIAPPDPSLLSTVGAVGANLGQSILRIRAEERRDRVLAEVERLNEQLRKMNLDLLKKTREAEGSKAEADSANRAKSEFLATMSHELRTPINAIIGYAELLEEEISGPINADQRLHLERIASSSRHLVVLINDVLDLAKIEAGRLEVDARPGMIHEVVEEALSLVRPQAAAAKLELVNTTAGRRDPYVGDPDRARQIIINLLTNAVKFTPGGTVTVRTGRHGESEGEPSEAEGRWTYVAVEDDGIGISAADLERIFEPFEQADSGATRKRGGTGLGLTISKHLARLMGGDLTAESEEGSGSRFVLRLPARPEEVETPAGKS